MYYLGYSPGTIRSLYEINKTSNIVVDTPVGKTSSITVEEVVKQGTIFGPIMCCASTSRVNGIQEAVKYQYGKVEIGMPVFMDDIAAVGTADNIRKGIQNCRRMEIEKKMMYGLKKTKYMVINTGKEPEEVIEERVKEGIVQETDIYKYLGMVINKSGNLKDHILELNKKSEVINKNIRAIVAKNKVGKEEIRVKLKLCKACLMPALVYGLEAWGKIDKDEMNEIEKIQGRALKKIFNLPISTSYIDLTMEKGTWPANQRIQYTKTMLYHNINSDHKKIARKILAEQTKSNHKNTMISKVQQIAQEIGVKLKNVENMSKSKWKKQVKEKIGKSIEERTKQEMTNKTKARTIIEDKWERKKYLQECDSETIKDVIKIRLQINIIHWLNNGKRHMAS